MTQPVEILYAVPVGTVISWFPPPGAQTDTGYTLPPGFALCDGNVIDDPDSPFNGVAMPDLQASFVLGARKDIPVGASFGSVDNNFNGWQSQQLGTGPTEASYNDNTQLGIIQHNNPTNASNEWRYYLSQDNETWYDGNHHHSFSFYLPPPGSIALLYIMRIK